MLFSYSIVHLVLVSLYGRLLATPLPCEDTSACDDLKHDFTAATARSNADAPIAKVIDTRATIGAADEVPPNQNDLGGASETQDDSLLHCSHTSDNRLRTFTISSNEFGHPPHPKTWTVDERNKVEDALLYLEDELSAEASSGGTKIFKVLDTEKRAELPLKVESNLSPEAFMTELMTIFVPPISRREFDKFYSVDCIDTTPSIGGTPQEGVAVPSPNIPTSEPSDGNVQDTARSDNREVYCWHEWYPDRRFGIYSISLRHRNLAAPPGSIFWTASDRKDIDDALDEIKEEHKYISVDGESFRIIFTSAAGGMDEYGHPKDLSDRFAKIQSNLKHKAFAAILEEHLGPKSGLLEEAYNYGFDCSNTKA